MLLRILSGSSLYALVLTAAVAAPLAPVGDGTRPPSPVIEARNSSVTNSDVTGSLGTGRADGLERAARHAESCDRRL